MLGRAELLLLRENRAIFVPEAGVVGVVDGVL